MKMKKRINKKLIGMWAFIFLIILSTLPPSKNPYTEGINVVAFKAQILPSEISLISAEFTSFLFFSFVDLKLETSMNKKNNIIKSGLIKYPFQNKYKIRNYSVEIK